MKILSIKIKNIHSLKGEHHIDFDKGILAETGLYAITGQTGAGKSSILDAITLSLYGSTNRHGKGEAEEIITRNEKEAFAETVFEINQQKYLARWSVARNKKNNINDWELFFYKKVDNELIIISEKKSISLQEIQKIVGLSYEQFTKSVLLAQNNFSAFLKAKPSERAEMLSKITGTEIYELISKLVFEKSKKLEEEIKIEKLSLTQDLFSEEIITEFQTLIDLSNITLKQNNETVTILNEKIKWLEDIVKNKTETTINETEKLKLENLAIQNEPNYIKLEKYNKAKSIEKELSDYQNEESILNKNLEIIEKRNKEKVETEEKFSKNQSILFPKTKTLTELKSEYESKKENISKAKEVIINVKNIEKIIIESKNQSNEIGLKSKSITESLLKNETERKKINTVLEIENNKCRETILFAKWSEKRDIFKNLYNQINESNKFLESKNLLLFEESITKVQLNIQEKNKKLENIKIELEPKTQKVSEISTQQSEIKAISVLMSEKEIETERLLNWKNYLLELSQKNSLESSLTDLKITFDKNIEQETIFQKDTNQLENNLLLFNENYSLQQKIASFEAHRAELKHGEDCPLCGATEHPYAQKTQNSTLTDTKKKIDSLTSELKNAQKSLDTCIQNKVKIETEIKIKTENFDKVLLKIKEIQQILAIEKLENTIEIQTYISDIEQNITVIDANIKRSERLEKEIAALKTSIDESKNQIIIFEKEIIQLDAYFKTKQQELLSENMVIEQKKSLITNCYTEIEVILKTFDLKLNEHSLKELKEIGIKINNHFDIYNQALVEIEKLKIEITKIENINIEQNSSLQSYVYQKTEIELKIAENENIFSDLKKQLNDLSKDFQIINPTEEENRLQNTLELLQNELNILNQENTKFSTEFKNLETIIAQFEIDKISNVSALNNYSTKLNLALQQKKFGSIDELQLALNFPDFENIALQKKENDDKIIAINAMLESLKNGLNELESKNLTNETIENLVLENQNIVSQNQSLQQEIGATREKLYNDKSQKLANAKKIERIQAQELVYDKWKQLNDLIGSNTGDKFKKFAQDFTLSLLVQYANRHLQTMYDRYELFKAEDSTEMELQIKDKHFYGQIRAVNSLSGGETFLLSLALAIGLSDLASKNTKIRSLFIDEGFGSLDPESLNNALDALELLRQTDDRQIGIISHVEELKKRIHTQIKVNKISAEFSEIVVSDEN